MLTKSGNYYDGYYSMNYDGINEYTGMYSISFGDIKEVQDEDNLSYFIFSPVANTWNDWHLIPSTRHSIAVPAPTLKTVDIPGTEWPLDLSTYLTGRQEYGQRSGTLSFLVDPGYEHWTSIYENMVYVLHGKKLKMQLADDPEYYYDGQFTVGNWETGETNSAVSINYVLKPYKMKINTEGSTPMIWDLFNFDKDHDYSMDMSGAIEVENNETKSFTIYAKSYLYRPEIKLISGSVSVKLGLDTGSQWVAATSEWKSLDYVNPGTNFIAVKGTGKIKMAWRGGSL